MGSPLLFFALAVAGCAPHVVPDPTDRPAFEAALPWPAEEEARALNLTELCEGFRQDLSGAVWNPVTETLWVCRNGPGADSKLWVLERDAQGVLELVNHGGGPAEWSGLGDCEGVTFADFAEPVVFLIVEGLEQIHELDVGRFGETSIRRVYDTSPFLPRDGRYGAEGITFVPDEHLERAGFLDGTGEAARSRGGMGGLMFVGHQNGGGLFAFDLDRASGGVRFVGEYRIPPPAGLPAERVARVNGLEFDRSTGELLVWHGAGNANALSVAKLSSRPVAGRGFRTLEHARVFRGPGDRPYEGIAVVPASECENGERTLFLTVDNSKRHALLRYERFTLGCDPVGASPPETHPEDDAR